MMKSKNIKGNDILWSSGFHALASIGPCSEKVIVDILKKNSDSETTLFQKYIDEELQSIAQNLKSFWVDEKASELIDYYHKAICSGKSINTLSLVRWILLHINKVNSVIECINVNPPDEIDITNVLSEVGSQKLVFAATWRLTQMQVVVKTIKGPPEKSIHIIKREAQSHPLNIKHKNIIVIYIRLFNKYNK